MPVISFEADDLFVIRITKYLSSNPDRKWANSYEFRATAGGNSDALLALGTALSVFESSMHHSSVTFDRILISTWEPDSVPYNPASFISSTLTLTGARGGLADLMSLNNCLNVTRQAASGRFGHIFYRGFLLEDDVSAPAGKSVLNDRPGIQDDMDGAIASSGLGDYIGTAPAAEIQLVMISADGTNIRVVNNLRVSGVSVLPLDHAWFNRTTP